MTVRHIIEEYEELNELCKEYLGKSRARDARNYLIPNTARFMMATVLLISLAASTRHFHQRNRGGPPSDDRIL